MVQALYRKRILVVITILFTGLLLSFSLFFLVNRLERQHRQFEFSSRAQDRVSTLRVEFNAYIEALYSIRNFYDSSQRVDRDPFEQFSSKVLLRHPAILFLAWLPRLADDYREEYERSVQTGGSLNFHVTEQDGAGNFLNAKRKKEYFPMLYMTPFKGNEEMLGFDPFSNTLFREAMEKARDADQPFAARPLDVSKNLKVFQLYIFLPIYRQGMVHNLLEERRQNLIGFISMHFDIPRMVEITFERLSSAGVNLYLYDAAADSREPFIYFSKSDLEHGELQPKERAVFLKEDKGLFWQTDFEMAGRTWTLLCLPSEPYFNVRVVWQAWFSLMVGLLLTMILALYLLNVFNREAQVQSLVEQRTAELVAANEKLSIEINHRKEAEDALLRSNKELEQFAYVASHDLQEPLRMVASYVQLLGKRYHGKLDQDADEFIRFAVDGAVRMQNLINDLLSYSRLTTQAKPFEKIDSRLIFDEALQNLKFAIEENKAQVSQEGLPEIMGDRVQMMQLFQNLIANAIKFHDQKTPRIHVKAERKDQSWLFSVQDNGIGFDPQYTDRIFEIFKRLHTQAEYSGSGIGLAVCKKIVERHGGSIWAKSEVGKGATFYFALPCVK